MRELAEQTQTMTGVDICVRNARLRRHGDALVDIAIAGGRIVALGPALDVAAREEIDAGGNLVTESYVNPHLHLCKVWTLPVMTSGGGAAKAIAPPAWRCIRRVPAIDLASKVEANYDASWIVPNARRADGAGGALRLARISAPSRTRRRQGAARRASRAHSLASARGSSRGIVDLQVVARLRRTRARARGRRRPADA